MRYINELKNISFVFLKSSVSHQDLTAARGTEEEITEEVKLSVMTFVT